MEKSIFMSVRKGDDMIAIIAAMEEEVDAIVKLMDDVQEQVLSGIKLYEGILSKKKVLVLQSGVGKGNAAITTTILMEHFTVSHVINIGTAGGLSPDENILDVVVSEKVVQHDFDTSCLDGEEGIGLYFTADASLIDLCRQELSNSKHSVFCGLVASGDQFISEEKQLKRLKDVYPDAICAEMEAGAVAQVCSHYKVPFVVIRSLSDIAFKDDSHMDFLEYTNLASERSAISCKNIIEKIKT